MIALLSLFVRELRIAARIGGGRGIAVVFFLIMVTIVPFAIGPDLKLLSRVGPAILWVAALLATLLGLDRLFQADEEDGSLDLMLMSRTPIELIVAVKCFAHWASTGLILTVAAPVFGLMLALDTEALARTSISLLAGTPALTFLGAIGASLTVTLRRGGLLMAVLVLPLAMPVLIFGVSAANAANGLAVPFLPPFLALCGLSLLSIALGPFAAAAALRHARD